MIQGAGHGVRSAGHRAQVVLIVQDLQDSKAQCRTKRRLYRMDPLPPEGPGVGSGSGHRSCKSCKSCRSCRSCRSLTMRYLTALNAKHLTKLA